MKQQSPVPSDRARQCCWTRRGRPEEDTSDKPCNRGQAAEPEPIQQVEHECRTSTLIRARSADMTDSRWTRMHASCALYHNPAQGRTRCATPQHRSDGHDPLYREGIVADCQQELVGEVV